MEARAALLAANELLRYRPVDDLYEEWLDRVAELAPSGGCSCSPRRPNGSRQQASLSFSVAYRQHRHWPGGEQAASIFAAPLGAAGRL